MLTEELTTTGVISLYGQFVSQPEPSHIVNHVLQYVAQFAVDRLSDTKDILPIHIPEDNLDMCQIGKVLYVRGYLHTHNYTKDDKRHMSLGVCAQRIENVDKCPSDNNKVELSGFCVKKPILRNTPKGMIICETIVAVNYDKGISSYIPCIAFGDMAYKVNDLKCGDQISISGRLQSRTYKKETTAGYVDKVTYECAIHSLIRK